MTGDHDELRAPMAALAAEVLPSDAIIDTRSQAGLHSLNNTILFAESRSSISRYVIRLPSRGTAAALGIRREEEAAAIEAAAASGITPPPLGMDAHGIIISPFLAAQRQWVGTDWVSTDHGQRGVDLVRSLLATRPSEGDVLPSTFERISRMMDGARSAGSSLPEEAALRRRLERIATERTADDRYPPCLAHHDVWANNIIDDGEQLWLVDYEFAGVGDGWYDLATIVTEAGIGADRTAAFLRSVGRSGEAEDLRALEQGKWLLHLFEAVWATIMAAKGTIRLHHGESFDYHAHAQNMWSWLLNNMTP